MNNSSATLSAARQGREALATALLSLQASGLGDPRIARAVVEAAAASSALYQAESSSQTDEALANYIYRAAESLDRALKALRELRETRADSEVAATAIARTLALLYPALKLFHRQRRARMKLGALSDSDADELRAMTAFPAAPTARGRSSRPAAFQGNERRGQKDRRVFVEVEIGLFSASHFYTGLSMDVSAGGVFVSTYEPAPPGTSVSLCFVLPDGHAVDAQGVVRWTRDGTEDAPPGMGVAFVSVSQASLSHIARFCESRPALYFDDAQPSELGK